jgi:hypothetical protein
MATNGRLTHSQQIVIGANRKTAAELVAAGWWDLNGEGQTVLIHDWAEHNGARDARKVKERERLRAYRASKR